MLAGGIAIQGPAWAGTPAVVVPAAIGQWPLNGTLADISGNGLNLTMENGAVTYIQLDPTFAGLGTGFAYDSSRNQIAPASALLRIVGDLTIAFLFNPNSTALQTYVQCEGTGNLYAYYYSAGGLGNFGQSYADRTVNLAIGTPNPPGIGTGTGGRAHHYCMRRRNTGGTTYVVDAWQDGVAQAGSVTTALQVTNGTERMRVGGFSGGPNLVGRMAQLRVWGAALTDAQIKADYNSLLGSYYGFV